MHVLTRLFAVGLCAAAAASAAQAQQQRLSPARSPAPTTSAPARQALPNPAGLSSPFPAGVSSGSGTRVSTDPVAASTAPAVPSSVVPGDGTVTGGSGGLGVRPELGPPAAPATNVLGAGATVAGPSQYLGGAGGFNATDQARSFFFADANQDGELTRAEAARLSIRTMPFEEMDRNFDGVITRFEYQDATR
ncbi:EF-hand domain-containing protein [Ramlibacter pallidus]|uniref:EF-hand domain-containing protein n=1 Tax=Ramlibacter pallidus TaxID=2780087 RepID=A0ABR9S258_9BURK|nr:EF-hand domain-containing protein [Ramlibacter pallidus]MBE7367591.1 hypothetical protein [Ramlibacter pallidus]